MTSKVDHPVHYNNHPSGIECIAVVEHMNFCLGNAIKYIWRADEKENALEDLEKAVWYLRREIERRQKQNKSKSKIVSNEHDIYTARYSFLEN